jgi:hypothetical protein
MRTILSLCDFTGNWSEPYRLAGYEVICIDLQNGQDVRKLNFIEQPIHGILMAPPCTHFSRAGASHWKAKGEGPILEGLAVVDACLRAAAIYRPDWWVLENPIGRLKDYLGPAKWKFDPHMFGDPWTKRTWLWGHFTPPMPMFSAQARKAVSPTWSAPGGVLPAHKERDTQTLPSKRLDRTTWLGSRRRIERSATPPGFAQAFFEANP